MDFKPWRLRRVRYPFPPKCKGVAYAPLFPLWMEHSALLLVIGIHEKAFVIYEWSSLIHGAGNTKEALKWLRSQGAEQIIACNVRMPVEPGQAVERHIAYWIHMKHSGLVDTLVDDDGYNFLVPDRVQAPLKKPRHDTSEFGTGF